jgi:hypothetical protein
VVSSDPPGGIAVIALSHSALDWHPEATYAVIKEILEKNRVMHPPARAINEDSKFLRTAAHYTEGYKQRFFK